MSKLKFNIQCSALDEKGKQCRNLAIVSENYHGDLELYGFYTNRNLPWVKVFFCKKHKEDNK